MVRFALHLFKSPLVLKASVMSKPLQEGQELHFFKRSGTKAFHDLVENTEDLPGLI